MKKLNQEMIKKLFNLCNIGFVQSDIDAFEAWASKIILELDKLKKINTDGIEPSYYCNDDIRTFMRDDEFISTISKDEVLRNAPENDGDFVLIAKVVK